MKKYKTSEKLLNLFENPNFIFTNLMALKTINRQLTALLKR